MSRVETHVVGLVRRKLERYAVRVCVCVCKMVKDTSTENRAKIVFKVENMAFNNVQFRIVVQSNTNTHS